MTAMSDFNDSITEDSIYKKGFEHGRESILKRTCATCLWTKCYIQRVVSRDDVSFSCNKYVEGEKK